MKMRINPLHSNTFAPAPYPLSPDILSFEAVRRLSSLAASDFAQPSTNPAPAHREAILAMGERIFWTGSPDFQQNLLHQIITSFWLPSSITMEERRTTIEVTLWALKEIEPRDAAEGLLATLSKPSCPECHD